MRVSSQKLKIAENFLCATKFNLNIPKIWVKQYSLMHLSKVFIAQD